VNPRTGARTLAAGRVLIGLGLLLAPRRLGKLWVSEHARGPAVQMLLRAVGARDAVIGMIALHTLDHPEIGPRWQRTAAALDAIDAGVTIAARSELPSAAVAGTVLLVGSSAVAGARFASALAG
jgi:hypothetical protein